MKVLDAFSTFPNSLRFALELADELSTSPREADLILSDAPLSRDEFEQKTLNRVYSLPRVLVDLLGFDSAPYSTREDYLLAKWFDFRKGWSDWAFVGIPIWGTCNGGLGLQTVSALAGRYIEDFYIAHMFENPDLREALEALFYRGLVTLKMTLEEDTIVELTTGAPYTVIYNLLEGRGPQTVGEFFSKPIPAVLSSWTCSTILYRWEPRKLALSPELTLGQLKHYWRVSTEGSVAGIVSSWGYRLDEAVKRNHRTAESIKFPSKTYRTDVARVAGSVWAALLDKGIV